VSTIIPRTATQTEIESLARSRNTYLYYSLYSLNSKFRKFCLPNAMEPTRAFELMRIWQTESKKRIRLHFCFIEDQNDSLEEIDALCALLDLHHLDVDLNIVRFNPYSHRYGNETSERVIQRNFEYLKALLPDALIKVVPRVGIDVFASCGMFVGDA